MTVLEEIVQIVHTLPVEEQRQVLDLASRLRSARALPDIPLPAAPADESAWDAWDEGVRARSAVVLEQERQRLQTLGLIDERWNPRTDELPDDMRSSSKTSVET